MEQRSVQVPAARLPRWLSNFAERHGATESTITQGNLTSHATDGAEATIRPAFPLIADTIEDFLARACLAPRTGVLIVRRGGFLAAVVEGTDIVAGDAGRRHVQGRTAAGGWSQQRFARRRDKQVHELLDAAIEYAVRIILPALPISWLATGGDRALIDDAMTDPRLRPFDDLPRGPHLAVPDPRRSMLAELPALLTTARIDISEPDTTDDSPH